MYEGKKYNDNRSGYYANTFQDSVIISQYPKSSVTFASARKMLLHL